MKKSILIIALLAFVTGAFAQSKPQQKAIEVHPAIDTVKLKESVFADQNILAAYKTIEIAKKGLPGSATISASDATSAKDVLDGLAQLLGTVYNMRHHAIPTQK